MKEMAHQCRRIERVVVKLGKQRPPDRAANDEPRREEEQ